MTGDPITRQLQGKRWDSGWLAQEATTDHHVAVTHNLGLDLTTARPLLWCWFAPTDPSAGPPAWTAPKPLRGMQVDDAVTVGQGYDNPAYVLVTRNTLDLGFYAAMPLHSVFNPVTGTWTLYQTGWLRFFIWMV